VLVFKTTQADCGLWATDSSGSLYLVAGKMTYYAKMWDGTPVTITSGGSTTYNDGQMHMVVASWAGHYGQTVKVYVDGVEVGSGSHTAWMFSDPAAVGILNQTHGSGTANSATYDTAAYLWGALTASQAALLWEAANALRKVDAAQAAFHLAQGDVEVVPAQMEVSAAAAFTTTSTAALDQPLAATAAAAFADNADLALDQPLAATAAAAFADSADVSTSVAHDADSSAAAAHAATAVGLVALAADTTQAAALAATAAATLDVAVDASGAMTGAVSSAAAATRVVDVSAATTMAAAAAEEVIDYGDAAQAATHAATADATLTATADATQAAEHAASGAVTPERVADVSQAVTADVAASVVRDLAAVSSGADDMTVLAAASLTVGAGDQQVTETLLQSGFGSWTETESGDASVTAGADDVAFAVGTGGRGEIRSPAYTWQDLGVPSDHEPLDVDMEYEATVTTYAPDGTALVIHRNGSGAWLDGPGSTIPALGTVTPTDTEADLGNTLSVGAAIEIGG
jgi:hypothetical protein